MQAGEPLDARTARAPGAGRPRPSARAGPGSASRRPSAAASAAGSSGGTSSAVSSVCDELADRADVGGDDGLAGHHRLEDRGRHALGAPDRGHGEDVDATEQRRDVVAGLEADVGAELGGDRPELGVVGGVGRALAADQPGREGGGAVLSLEDGDGREQMLLALLRSQHADVADHDGVARDREAVAGGGVARLARLEPLGRDRRVDGDAALAELAGRRVQVGERLAPGRDRVGGADDVGHRQPHQRSRRAAVEDLPGDADAVVAAGGDRGLRVGRAVRLNDVGAGALDQLGERADLAARAQRQAQVRTRVGARPQPRERHRHRLDAGFAQARCGRLALVRQHDRRLHAALAPAAPQAPPPGCGRRPRSGRG